MKSTGRNMRLINDLCSSRGEKNISDLEERFHKTGRGGSPTRFFRGRGAKNIAEKKRSSLTTTG